MMDVFEKLGRDACPLNMTSAYPNPKWHGDGKLLCTTASAAMPYSQVRETYASLVP
jgi:hypothetical protein